ncbi:cadmium ABC transporter ATPase [Rhodopseudomonas sp. HC1]|uniref:cadmium ABC transporter ATPase n=1 Tax=Rhodopseudomonas infernalis TaxID=2897386 RepID=UPI001EE86E4A|nr:cadmium ABC transporter ATPase [Rhodopseudomonas infernalis]MCG6207276.1 cadmium ABC transporter ATPase [Rhodopseudomonas infernalis]
MSDITTLFQALAPLSFLLALVVSAVMAIVLIVRRFGGLISRRPRVVRTARHHDVVRQMTVRRKPPR